MKPLIVLLVVFCIALLVFKLTSQEYNFSFSARMAMCVMLCFTAIGHFAFTTGMALMIPDFVPYKTATVYLTGILEIVLGISLLIQSIRVYSGWLLISFLILILPANIKAATDKIDFQKGTFDGAGLKYLWFRVPLQMFFILWTYLSSIIN